MNKKEPYFKSVANCGDLFFKSVANCGDLFFKSVANCGDLFFEFSLLDFEQEPVLFVCSNKEKDLFLCHCSDIRTFQRWIVSRTNINILNDLISREIDIVTAIKACSTAKIIITSSATGETLKIEDVDKVDELDLPKIGVTLPSWLDISNINKMIQQLNNKEKESIKMKNAQVPATENKRVISDPIPASRANHIISEFKKRVEMYNKAIDMTSRKLNGFAIVVPKSDIIESDEHAIIRWQGAVKELQEVIFILENNL